MELSSKIKGLKFMQRHSPDNQKAAQPTTQPTKTVYRDKDLPVEHGEAQFVYQYESSLLKLLNPKPEDRFYRCYFNDYKPGKPSKDSTGERDTVNDDEEGDFDAEGKPINMDTNEQDTLGDYGYGATGEVDRVPGSGKPRKPVISKRSRPSSRY